jgi:hypothetical protein
MRFVPRDRNAWAECARQQGKGWQFSLLNGLAFYKV